MHVSYRMYMHMNVCSKRGAMSGEGIKKAKRKRSREGRVEGRMEKMRVRVRYVC